MKNFDLIFNAEHDVKDAIGNLNLWFGNAQLQKENQML